MLTPDQKVDKIRAAFGFQAFSGNDVATLLGVNVHGTGDIFKYMIGQKMIRKVRAGAYQFVQAKSAESPSVPQEAPVASVVAGELLPISPSLMRIGEFYMHERMLLIAHTGNQEGSPAIRIYTTIIEVDPATKHPRNKIINFIKSRDPREYAQTMAWLDTMAGNPPSVVDDTALELAAELEAKLNVANKEIADLKERIRKIQAVFSEATV